jgi:hypothetical protein
MIKDTDMVCYGGKGRVVSVHTIKTYQESRHTAPLILNLTPERREQSVSHHGHFTDNKEPWYPFNIKLDELLPVWMFWRTHCQDLNPAPPNL